MLLSFPVPFQVSADFQAVSDLNKTKADVTELIVNVRRVAPLLSVQSLISNCEQNRVQFWKTVNNAGRLSVEAVDTRGIALQVQGIFAWMFNLCVQYGYLGIFVMSLAGAVSIIVPVPDTIVVFTLAGLKIGDGWVFEPLLIALAATLGGAIGEVSGYLLGLTSKKVITGKYKKNMDFLSRVFNRFGAIAIFAFALTPLPDDLVFIPLGASRYNPIKAFAPALTGKLLICLAVAYGSRFSIGIIRDIFGVGSDLMSVAISTGIGIAFATAMFKVDWARCFEKYSEQTPNGLPSMEVTLDSEKAKTRVICSWIGLINYPKPI